MGAVSGSGHAPSTRLARSRVQGSSELIRISFNKGVAATAGMECPRVTAQMFARLVNRSNAFRFLLPQTSRKPNIAIAVEAHPPPAARQSPAGGDRGTDRGGRAGTTRSRGAPCRSSRLSRRALPASNAGTVRAGMEDASGVRGFPPRRAARWRSAKPPPSRDVDCPGPFGWAGGGRDDALDRARRHRPRTRTSEQRCAHRAPRSSRFASGVRSNGDVRRSSRSCRVS